MLHDIYFLLFKLHAYLFLSLYFLLFFNTKDALIQRTVVEKSECSVCFECSSRESVREAGATKQQQHEQWKETLVFMVD